MNGAIIAEERNVQFFLLFDKHTNLITKYIVKKEENVEVFYSYSKAEKRFQELVKKEKNGYGSE